MITHRILTGRSKLGRGTYPDETVERLIATGKAKYVRSAYYNYAEIDFTQEVQAQAGIFIKVTKPGTAHDKYLDNERLNWDKEREALGEKAYMGKVAAIKHTRRIAKSNASKRQRLDGLGIKATRAALNQGKLKQKPYDV